MAQQKGINTDANSIFAIPLQYSTMILSGSRLVNAAVNQGGIRKKENSYLPKNSREDSFSLRWLCNTPFVKDSC